jgi:hypothetical protein
MIFNHRLLNSEKVTDRYLAFLDGSFDHTRGANARGQSPKVAIFGRSASVRGSDVAPCIVSAGLSQGLPDISFTQVIVRFF